MNRTAVIFLKNNLRKFIRPSLENFAERQKQSAISLIEKVAFCEGRINEKQSEFLNEVKSVFEPKKAKFKQW